MSMSLCGPRGLSIYLGDTLLVWSLFGDIGRATLADETANDRYGYLFGVPFSNEEPMARWYIEEVRKQAGAYLGEYGAGLPREAARRLLVRLTRIPRARMRVGSGLVQRGSERPQQTWWVRASEEDGVCWHWEEFFDDYICTRQPIGWGGLGWPRSAASSARIGRMKRSDLVIAYQAGVGVFGLTCLARDGDVSVDGGPPDLLWLDPTRKVRLEKPARLKDISGVSGPGKTTEPLRIGRDVISEISPAGARRIIKAVVTMNPGQRADCRRLIVTDVASRSRSAPCRVSTSSI